MFGVSVCPSSNNNNKKSKGRVDGAQGSAISFLCFYHQRWCLLSLCIISPTWLWVTKCYEVHKLIDFCVREFHKVLNEIIHLWKKDEITEAIALKSQMETFRMPLWLGYSLIFGNLSITIRTDWLNQFFQMSLIICKIPEIRTSCMTVLLQSSTLGLHLRNVKTDVCYEWRNFMMTFVSISQHQERPNSE